jgi:CcmD family protein
MVVGVGLILMVSAMTGGVSLDASGQAPPAQDEFIPLEQVPPGDQLPAAPLLVAAYMLIWVAVLVYVWSIWRRMMTVERELAILAKSGEDQ